MGTVNHDPVVPALETTGPVDSDETSRNFLFGDIDFSDAQGRHGEGRVFLLVFPLQPNLRSAVIDRRYKFERSLALDGTRTNDLLGGWLLLGRHHRHLEFDDPSLFAGDRFEGIAQPFLMVVANR